jgi:hypothetical protein
MAKPVIISKPFNVVGGEIVDPQGELKKYSTQGADIPSAQTIDLGSATGDYVRVTGTTNIQSLGVAPAGVVRTVEFTGVLKLIYNSSSMILPGGVDLVTAPYDAAIFRSRGNGNWICVSFQSASGAPPLQLTPDDVGLGNVENVALSTWPGSTNLSTVGTITAGVWQGSPIAPTKGGTGMTTILEGELIYGSSTNACDRLAKNTVKTRYIANTGINNIPKWDVIDLASGVTGVLPGANGGRGALGQVITAPTGITLAIDLALGNYIQVDCGSATGNLTLTFTNPTPGLLCFLQVTQGATIRALIWPTGSFQTLQGGRTWNPSGASKIDVITFVYNATNTYIILGTAPDIGTS